MKDSDDAFKQLASTLKFPQNSDKKKLRAVREKSRRAKKFETKFFELLLDSQVFMRTLWKAEEDDAPILKADIIEHMPAETKTDLLSVLQGSVITVFLADPRQENQSFSYQMYVISYDSMQDELEVFDIQAEEIHTYPFVTILHNLQYSVPPSGPAGPEPSEAA